MLETTAAAAAVAASPDDVPTEAAATASPTTLALDAPPSPLDEGFLFKMNFALKCEMHI